MFFANNFWPKCARKMADPILEMANERESDTFDLKSKLIEQNFRVYAAIL